LDLKVEAPPARTHAIAAPGRRCTRLAPAQRYGASSGA
jgi:hypothetical protein